MLETAGASGSSEAPPPPAGWTGPRAYALAVLGVAAALGLRLAFAKFLVSPFLTFIPVVALVALVGGLRPGLAATLLSAVLSFWFILREEQGGGPWTGHAVEALVFAAVGALLAWVADRLRRSLRRVQDLEAMRKAERQFRSLADQAPVLIWASGPDGLCTWFNQPWLDFTGRTFEQERGDGWAAGVHPEDLERCLSLYRGAFARREPFSMEYRLRRRDGEYRWLLDHGQPRHEADGAFAGFTGSCVDVTEQRRAREAQRLTHARLSQHLANTPLGVVEWDAGYRVVAMSPRAEEIFGWSAGELVGKRIEETGLVPAEAWGSVGSVMQDMASGARPSNVNANRNLRKDGSTIECEWYNSALHDETGRLVSVFSLVLDVTARVRAEGRSREDREKLALFVEHAPAAIAMLDRDLRYLAASRRYLRDYGLSEQAVVGRRHYDLFPDLPERWREIHRRCLAGAVERSEADPFPRGDGRTDWVRWELRPWQEAGGGIGGLVLFSEVITERVELERRATRAERAAALGTMAAGMAHEINNPLAYVLGGLAFTQERLEALPAACRAAWPGGGLREVREALAEASEGAGRVRDLLRDLRAFATGQHDAGARCDLPGALDRAARVARHAFAGGTELTTELPPLPPIAASDAELVQLFACLLINAGQAKGEGPNRIRVTAERLGSQVVTRISDTGRGIPAADLPRVFDPFFTTKGVGRGKGLGLPVALGIATGLGGGIDLESTPGAGTTATVRLPAATGWA